MTTTLEIVTFRAASGVDRASLLAAARGTDAAVRRLPGFLGRRLGCGEDGQWTDLVVWASLEDAKSAAAAITSDPSFAPYMAAIDMASVAMRHEEQLWQAG